jgi:hypothetical protein
MPICPSLARAEGHAQRDFSPQRDMSSVGPRGRTCAAGFTRSVERAFPGVRRDPVPSAGHAQCWSRATDIMPICPSLARAEGHVQPDFSPSRDMSSIGPRRATCPAEIEPFKGHVPSLARADAHALRDFGPPRDMSSAGLGRGTCPAGFEGCEGHVQRRVLTLGMSRGGQEATPPALPGPRAIRVQGLRVRRPVPGVSR